MDLADTIVALASAPGPGARAVIRLSGSEAASIAKTHFTSATPISSARRLYSGSVRCPSWSGPLPADLLVWPGPRSYTGQDMAELHLFSSVPLVESTVAALLDAGARAAQPGEFTLRAFLAGKRDLPRAEAVHAVITAADRAELKLALAQLAGGITQPLDGLRDDLLNLLADVEAGLDFSEEDIQFVGRDDLLLRLARGLAHLTTLKRQIEDRTVASRPFRAVLAGAANAGKSSLFNALGQASALVSAMPGTTRDYLLQRLNLDGAVVELADTAGWQPEADEIERQAQSLGAAVAQQADLVLLCIEAGRGMTVAERRWLARSNPPVLGLATKCDLAAAQETLLPTSAVSGAGLADLRAQLARRARTRPAPSLAPSLSRCRHHVEACLDHLRRAHAAVLFVEPPELLALELRGALDELGAMAGAVYTEDLLDRIFSRFCIGK
jgi:tRNA modification GTPase